MYAGTTLTLTPDNGLLTNATGTNLTVAYYTDPAYGSVDNVESIAGTFTYTPFAGTFTGTDTFEYALTDGYNVSASASVTITILPVPTANAKSYTAVSDRPLLIAAPGLLQSDQGVNIQVAGNTPAANGTLQVHADGSFSYTSNDGFWGTDTFTYTVSDGTLTSTPATVTLTVYSVPVANDDTYSLVAGQALDVTSPAQGVLANDTNADLNPLTAQLVNGPSYGTLLLDDDGTFSYTQNGYAPAGQDSFSYTASDGYVTSNTATVTITINAVTGNGLGLLGAYDTGINFDSFGFDEIDSQVDFNWNDQSPGYPLGWEYYSVQWTGQVLAPQNGYYTFAALTNDGVRLWVDGQQLIDDWQDQQATWSYGNSIYLQAGQLYAITMNYYNDIGDSAAYLSWSYPGQALQLIPQCYLYGNPSCTLDTTTIYSSLPVGGTAANLLVAPGEAGVTLSCALVAGEGSDDNAAFTIDGTRLLSTLRFDPNVQHSYHIRIRTSDTNGMFSEFPFTLYIVNPLTANDDSYLTHQDTTLIVNNTSEYWLSLDTFTPNEEAAYAALTPFWFSFIWDKSIYSDVTLAEVQLIHSWGDNAIVAWQVNIDPEAQTYAAANGIRIITATQLGDLWNELLQAYVNQFAGVLSNDTNAEGLPFTAQLVAGPANGTVTLDPNGTFSYTPNTGFWGQDSFTYAATDGMATSAPATVYITVNSTPVAENNAYTTYAGQELDASDLLNYVSNADGYHAWSVLYSGPANGQLSLGTQGDISYVPNAGFSGTDSFTYAAANGFGAISAPATVTITVLSIPVANDDSYTTITGQELDVAPVNGVLVNDSNTDGLPLTAQLVDGPVYGQ